MFTKEEKGAFNNECKVEGKDAADKEVTPQFPFNDSNPNRNTDDPKDELFLETARKPLLPKAKNVGSQRNILILGTARAGKYTIAKHIATDRQNFPQQKPQKGKGVVNPYEYENFKFVTVDTAGACTSRQDDQNVVSISSNIKNHLQDGIHLILIAVRMECCPPEDLESLVTIIEDLFTPMAKNYIALVHTGCENLEDSERKMYIDKFASNLGPAGKLSSLCQKGLFSIGFPDLEQINKKYFQVYNESITKGKQELRRLVKDSTFIQPYTVLLRTRKPYEKLPTYFYKCALL